MPEYNQNYNYNFNSFYICLLLFVYNIWKNNYEYVNIIFSKLYLLNYVSLVILINIIGLYLLLNKLSFEVNVTWTVKYK
jgi:hypothetical protein